MKSRFLLMVLLLIGAASDEWAADEHPPSHWGYEGEESAAHWGMRSSAYMACEADSHQSPIDISMPSHAQQQERLVFQYRSGLLRALDNGHTIQVNVPPGNEGVQWIVLRDTISMSAQQIAQFVSVVGHNARPIQPLHDRKIYEE